jgi:hypothetical protein
MMEYNPAGLELNLLRRENLKTCVEEPVFLSEISHA